MRMQAFCVLLVLLVLQSAALEAVPALQVLHSLPTAAVRGSPCEP